MGNETSSGSVDRNSGLELVVVEDLYPAEPEGVDSELLLGVDLTEYFGGGDIDTADRVVVSQLKYSHRHPERSWIVAPREGQRTAAQCRRDSPTYIVGWPEARTATASARS